jgi:hypothetical protein
MLDPHALVMPVTDDPRSAAFVRALLVERWQPAPDADAVAALAAAADGAIVLVAVHHGNFPSLEYMAAALKDSGRRVVAIYLHGAPPADTFSAAVSCDGSLARLAAYVEAVPGRTIYVQAHARWSWLGQLVAAVRPDVRVIQEVWDWMDAFVEPRHEAAVVQDGLFTAAELATMRISEAWIRTQSGGFVHKHGGAALDTVVADARVPEVRILPCPPRAWMRAPDPPPSPWRLVHAGQIKPSTSSRRMFGDLHVRPLFASLCEQGLEVTAYTAAMAGSLDAVLGEYTELAREQPRFHIEPRLPIASLVAAMHGRHHFGILLYPFDDDLVVGKRHLQTALASKLFAYVAAGLPILVSPELEFMAELVRSHGIGLVVPRRDLAALAHRLEDIDYPALCAAVARAQPSLCIETQLPDVLRLVDGAP